MCHLVKRTSNWQPAAVFDMMHSCCGIDFCDSSLIVALEIRMLSVRYLHLYRILHYLEKFALESHIYIYCT